jgi:hypothetical protein
MEGTVTTRQLAFVALMGPLLFAATVVALTAIQWDFLHDLGWSAGLLDSPDTPWPSSTALGDYGYLQGPSFLVLGASVLALAVALFRLLDVRRKIGPSLLVLLAAAFATSAFRTDLATATGAGPETWNGVAHVLGLTVVIPAALASMLVLAAQFRRDDRWRPLTWHSSIAAVVAFASLVATLAGAGNLFFVFLAVVLAWLTFVSAHALSLPRSPTSPPSGPPATGAMTTR